MPKNRNRKVVPIRNSQTLAADTGSKPRRALNYTPKSVYRTRQDVASWNRALNLAQAQEPKNYALQLLYDEIMTDALLFSQVQNRKQQIFSIDFVLKKPNDEVDEEQTRTLKNLPIYRFLTHAKLDSTYYGYTLLELGITQDVNGKRYLMGDILPRTNVVPKTGLFFPDYTDETNKIYYRDMPEYGTWILEFNTGDIGLLNKAVSHVLFKRFAQSCWSELCEIYGIPPRVMKTDTQDAASLNRAEKMMRDMGAASWFVIDETEEFEFAQGVSTNGDVYKNLIDHCRNELCMLIVGAIIAQDTKNGSRSKDESAQEMLWQLVQADMAQCAEWWNSKSIPALIKHGVLKGDLTFDFVPVEDISSLWSMVKEALSHFEFDIDWLNEKFGLKIVKHKTSKAGPADDEEDDPEAGEPGDVPKKGTKGQKKEKLSTLRQVVEFISKLNFFRPAPAQQATGAHLMNNCCGTPRTITLSKQFDDKPLIQQIYDAAGEGTFDARLFTYTAQTLVDAMRLGWLGKPPAQLSANIGFQYGIDDPSMLTAFEMNLFRFTGAKTLTEVQALNELYRKSKSFEDFERGAREILEKFNRSFLLTEYNTAYLVGESAALFARLMSQYDTFPYWQYKTVDDDRVRPEHQLLHDLILPYNDPRWKKLFPPNGWNCRCYVIGLTRAEVKDIDMNAMKARADAYFETSSFKQDEAQGWGVNRAESGEVFTANQQYMRKFPDKAAKMLNQLGAADYKLPSYSNAKKVATAPIPEYGGTSKDFYDALELVNGRSVVRDYNSRSVMLEPKNYRAHTTGKKTDRVKYLDAMVETMKAPDEVWINVATKGGKDNIISIKYYEDATMVVVSKIENNTVYQVNTWYELTEKRETIDRIRRGLLIFSKK